MYAKDGKAVTERHRPRVGCFRVFQSMTASCRYDAWSQQPAASSINTFTQLLYISPHPPHTVVMTGKRVVVTGKLPSLTAKGALLMVLGASGLLGRAVVKRFEAKGDKGK